MIDSVGAGPVGPSGQPLLDAAHALLTPFIELLPITGASISVVAGPGQSTLAVSDARAGRLEQLQFELGEGPHWQALRSGRAVLVPDLQAQRASWPVFGAALVGLDVGALFAFPLSIGAVVVGVVDLYREAPGALSAGDVGTARSMAAAAASTALRLAARSADDHERVDAVDAPELRRVVHQATGMVLVQLDVSATEAFARLRAHAFATGSTLESVAQDVVARRLTFSDRAASE